MGLGGSEIGLFREISEDHGPAGFDEHRKQTVPNLHGLDSSSSRLGFGKRGHVVTGLAGSVRQAAGQNISTRRTAPRKAVIGGAVIFHWHIISLIANIARPAITRLLSTCPVRSVPEFAGTRGPTVSKRNGCAQA